MRNELARTGHLTHGMLGCLAAFDKDLMELTYRDANTGEPLSQSFIDVAEGFFKDQNTATEVNSRHDRLSTKTRLRANPFNGHLSKQHGSSNSSTSKQRKYGLNARELKRSPALAAQPYRSDG